MAPRTILYTGKGGVGKTSVAAATARRIAAAGGRVIVLSTQPARIADDFTIAEPRPSGAAWQRSPETVRLEERILERLHAGSSGRGQIRVSV